MVPISLIPAFALLYFFVCTFRNMCAVPNMIVLCSSLTSWFPVMLLTYFLNDFEMVPVASIITAVTLVFTFHMRCISIVRSLYFEIYYYYYYYYYYCYYLVGLQRVRGIGALQLISTECVTCGGQSGMLTCFYTSSSVLPPQYHSSTPSYSYFIHLPPMLHNLSNFQRPQIKNSSLYKYSLLNKNKPNLNSMKNIYIVRLKCKVNSCRTGAYRRCHGHLYVVQPNKTNDLAMNSAFQGYRYRETHFIRDMNCMKGHERKRTSCRVHRYRLTAKICKRCALIMSL